MLYVSEVVEEVVVFFLSFRLVSQETETETTEKIWRQALSTRQLTLGDLAHSSGELLLLPSARSKSGVKMTRNICHD